VGLDCGRRGSAADRFSDHRRLEQQPQYGEQRLIADGDQQRTYEPHAEHDRFGLDVAAAGHAGCANCSGAIATVAGRREVVRN
jgi:hypothetical protein